MNRSRRIKAIIKSEYNKKASTHVQKILSSEATSVDLTRLYCFISTYGATFADLTRLCRFISTYGATFAI